MKEKKKPTFKEFESKLIVDLAKGLGISSLDPNDALSWVACDESPWVNQAVDEFDSMTAAGFKLNLITGMYEKRD